MPAASEFAELEESIVTLETLLACIVDELPHGPIDVREFVGSYYTNDIAVGQLLMRAFDALLLRGRLVSRLAEFDGHISSIADDTRPVWR